ncbi:MAG TPA: outer membrane beta-barrel protein [Flavipsychrobacter sp.]|nr:outer membrane beta-barrel protein [Flavipsychrobacter sp.]
MKKYLPFILLFVFTSSQLWAQDTVMNTPKKKTGLFLRVGLGYAFPQAGQTMDVNSNPYAAKINYSNFGSSYSFSLKKASFSAGLQGIAGVGYMVNQHIGFLVDAAIGIAPKKYTTTVDSLEIQANPANETVTQQTQTPVFVIPALLLQTGGTHYNLYVRAGIVLPAKSKVIAHIDDQLLSPATFTSPISDSNVNTINRTLETKSSFSLGFSGAAGVSYNINDQFKLWGEISFVSLSLYTKETDLTEFSVNGSNMLFNVPRSELSTKYGKSGNTVPTNSIGTVPAYSIPFSNVGINIGVSYHF